MNRTSVQHAPLSCNYVEWRVFWITREPVRLLERVFHSRLKLLQSRLGHFVCASKKKEKRKIGAAAYTSQVQKCCAFVHPRVYPALQLICNSQDGFAIDLHQAFWASASTWILELLRMTHLKCCSTWFPCHRSHAHNLIVMYFRVSAMLGKPP